MPTVTRTPPAERTVSGRAVVLGAVVAGALLVVAILVLGPWLRAATFGRASAPGEREVIAIGTVDDRVWEATATDDENGTCVAVSFPPLRERGTCARIDGSPPLQSLRVVDSPVTRAPVVMLVVRADVAAVRYELVEGPAVSVAVAEPDASFPAGFAVTALPLGAQVSEVTALDADGTMLATAACDRSAEPDSLLGDGCGLEATRV